MTKLHAGSPSKRQGVLHRGARPTPTPPYHGGSGTPTGRVHDAAAPKPSQRSTSWHAMAAAAKKRGG